PIISIACCLFLMVNLPLTTWIYFGIWLAIGVVVYFVYSKKHSHLKDDGSSQDNLEQAN
ncbi:amino acid permease C-terminal domain-containing protein, partial [Priestia sp. SIMBA_032]